MNILTENNYEHLNEFGCKLIHNIKTKNDLVKAVFYYRKDRAEAQYLVDLFINNLKDAISEGYSVDISSGSKKNIMNNKIGI